MSEPPPPPTREELAAAVVAAAQAWKTARQDGSASWPDVVGSALRLERAVDAYEAALAEGAAHAV